MRYEVRPAVSPGRFVIVDTAGVGQFVGTAAESRAWLTEAAACELEAEIAEHDRSGQSINPPGSGGQF